MLLRDESGWTSSMCIEVGVGCQNYLTAGTKNRRQQKSLCLLVKSLWLRWTEWNFYLFSLKQHTISDIINQSCKCPRQIILHHFKKWKYLCSTEFNNTQMIKHFVWSYFHSPCIDYMVCRSQSSSLLIQLSCSKLTFSAMTMLVNSVTLYSLYCSGN